MSEGKSLLDEILDEMDNKQPNTNVIQIDFKNRRRLSSQPTSHADTLYTFKALIRVPGCVLPKYARVIAYVRPGEDPKDACFRWGTENGLPVVSKLWHTKTTIEDMKNG